MLCTFTAYADSKLARINDTDGFINIRSGQSIDSPVVATFDKDDLFYCDWTNAAWLKVTVYKKNTKLKVTYTKLKFNS